MTFASLFLLATACVILGAALWDLVYGARADYDPTPWCGDCGARTAQKCHCPPRADND